MKYNKAILQVMLWGLVAVVLSCETEKIIFTGPYHVRFSDTLQTLKESHSQPVKIEVHLAGPQLQDDVTATYSITGTAREGIDYTIVGDRGKVKLTRESSFGYITVQLINNSNNILRSQTLILTLTGTDHANIGVGQDGGGLGKKFIFTIQDDCILGGNYQGLKDALSVPVEDITIISTDCEEYTLSNWDIDIFRFPRERSLKFIDNGDNTLTIPDQKDATLPADSATINGSGFVDPQTHDIFMKVKLADYTGQPEFSFKLIRD